jgi:Tfp pilus assembly protein PilF
LTLDPNFALGHANLAEAFTERGKIDAARRHYHRALQLDPNNAKARAELDKLLRGQ